MKKIQTYTKVTSLIKAITSSVLVLMVLFLANTTIVNASPTKSAPPADPCANVQTTIIPCFDGGIWGILLITVNIMVAGVGLAAIGGIVYASILYATAEGNAGQVTKAKETIFNVVVGLVLFVGMWALLQFIVPGGVFK